MSHFVHNGQLFILDGNNRIILQVSYVKALRFLTETAKERGRNNKA